MRHGPEQPPNGGRVPAAPASEPPPARRPVAAAEEPAPAASGCSSSPAQAPSDAARRDPSAPSGRAYVLIDHGSRRPEANAVLETLAQALRQRLTPGEVREVAVAHLEAAEPSLAVAIARCVAAGAQRVFVQPVFLVPGKHARRDIPELLREARATHPGVEFELGDVFGADPLIAELLERRFRTGPPAA